ncbi:hypothetical protein [Streptosporangium sp. NPDC002524]
MHRVPDEGVTPVPGETSVTAPRAVAPELAASVAATGHRSPALTP